MLSGVGAEAGETGAEPERKAARRRFDGRLLVGVLFAFGVLLGLLIKADEALSWLSERMWHGTRPIYCVGEWPASAEPDLAWSGLEFVSELEVPLLQPREGCRVELVDPQIRAPQLFELGVRSQLRVEGGRVEASAEQPLGRLTGGSSASFTNTVIIGRILVGQGSRLRLEGVELDGVVELCGEAVVEGLDEPGKLIQRERCDESWPYFPAASRSERLPSATNPLR